MERVVSRDEQLRRLDVLAMVPVEMGLGNSSEIKGWFRATGEGYFAYQFIRTEFSSKEKKSALKLLLRISKAAKIFSCSIEALPASTQLALCPDGRGTPPRWGVNYMHLLIEAAKTIIAAIEDPSKLKAFQTTMDSLRDCQTRMGNDLESLCNNVRFAGERAVTVATRLENSASGELEQSAEDWLINCLAEKYTALTGQKAKAPRRRATQEYYGEFFDISKRCLEALGVDHATNTGWGDAMRRGLGTRKKQARRKPTTKLLKPTIIVGKKTS